MLKLKSFATLNLSTEKSLSLCDQATRKIARKVTQIIKRESYGI